MQNKPNKMTAKNEVPAGNVRGRPIPVEPQCYFSCLGVAEWGGKCRVGEPSLGRLGKRSGWISSSSTSLLPHF